VHRCHVTDAGQEVVGLAPEEAHHLTRVLRARVGDEVIAFDGRGHEWRAVVHALGRDQVTLRLVAAREPAAEPPVHLTLAVGLLKGDQMHEVVRDATVLGAAVIHPFVSSHTAVPERAWHDRVLDKWQRVSVAAAKQSGRAVVPELRAVTSLSDALATAADGRFACVEPARTVTAAALPSRPPGPRVLVLVGPEGGWSASDLARIEQAGTHLLQLGPRTLRASTAPIVALSVLWATWGWVRG
jgi:16S rRNA (uracil1498-N3)-methyltransferase